MDEEKKEIKIPMKFNPAVQKYEPDMEKLNEKVEEMNKEKMSKENFKEKKELDNHKNKEGSFRPVIIIMIASLFIVSLWDKFPQLKNSIHFILDPTAGSLLHWNLNLGMLIVVFIITLFTTIVQKYATDQKKLKDLREEQKEIQKQMKELKNHPAKLLELQKKQFKLMPKQMKLSMRALAYTGIPFILFFRWFTDYFTSAGNPKLWLGMSWFLFYILGAIIIGMILRKKMDVV